MKRTERTLYFYDLHIGSRAVHARPPLISELVDAWRAMFQDQDAVILRDRGAIVFRVGDLRIDEETQMLSILIRKSDQNAPDAAYSDVDTGKIRFVRKNENEGGDTAAHFVVSLLPEADKPDTHMSMLEGVAGITHRHVQPLLNAVIRVACNHDPERFTYPDASGARHRDGSEKRHKFQPKIELRGHISENLTRDIERGKVQGLELTRSGAAAVFGGDQFLSEKEKALKVSVDENIPAQNRLQRLVQAMCSRSDDYSTGRIKFTDENDKSHKVDYDLQSGTPEQQLYIKSCKLEGIDPPLAQSSERVVEYFVDSVKQQLQHERNV